MKVLLILVDGMRPDALPPIQKAKEIMGSSRYTMEAKTVFPSVTLPCHMSLFHSVDPARHGITTNLYTPPVRPVNGICEVLLNAGKGSAFFYNWEEIRDLARPNSLDFAYFCKGRKFGYDVANDRVTDAAISYLNENDTDFAFVYMGYTDAAGHNHGWMSEQYIKAMENSWNNIARLIDGVSEDYAIIITADHGGHDRAHGSDLPEDMTIPMIVTYKGQVKELDLTDANIKDIAPTVTQLLGVAPDSQWEGKSLLI